ncbi:hypothetical protein QJS10_CPA16g00637 [Acorus calamus]|uniref:Uncharacterized protein n=1 Tax=Acorus calamus TaxID=4465 RepID=A0AAV9CY39_ACOCL|nr:hypothetical protein QJS10_CPA16g00637 [Acorus calamus]
MEGADNPYAILQIEEKHTLIQMDGPAGNVSELINGEGEEVLSSHPAKEDTNMEDSSTFEIGEGDELGSSEPVTEVDEETISASATIPRERMPIELNACMAKGTQFTPALQEGTSNSFGGSARK